MHLKIRSLFVLAVGLALVISGCGVKPDDNHPVLEAMEEVEKVTINMMHLWPEVSAAGQHHVVNKIIDEYQEEHPNVIIQQEVYDNERYKARIKVLSTVNELPDVGVTWAAGYLQPFVGGELFTPLDDLLQSELQDSFIAGSTEAYTVDGKTYALPLEFNIAPVYYNKEIFAKYGLQVPTTYNEFVHIVQTLVANGIEPIALGNKDRWTGSLWYMYMADRIAGTEALANAIKGTFSFADLDLIEAAERIQELVDMNAFNAGFNGLSDDEVKAKFINGKTAMYMIGTWELPNFTTNQDVSQVFRDSVGFFKFPTVNNGKSDIDSWVGGPGVGLFVAEDSLVKSEAKKFVKYFVKRWGEESVTGAGVISASKVNTSKIQLPQLYIDLLTEVNKATSITLFADVQMARGAADVHLNQIQALFGKEITPEEFARAHDQVIKTGK